MQIIESSLKFQNYGVDKMVFSLNDSYVCETEHSIELKPGFSRVIRKIDENEFDLLLGVTIQQKEEELPFSLEVTVKGNFFLEGIEDKEECMKVNAVAILFPYLRTTVSMLMSLANIEPLFMPVINLVKMFEVSEKSSKEQVEQ